MFERVVFGAFAVAVMLAMAPMAGANEGKNSCSGAQSKTDWLVCRDMDLADMDQEMRGLFVRIEAETAGVDGETGQRIDPFADEHLKWVAEVRNKCPDVACLKAAYTARLADVKKRWAEALN